MKKYEKIGVGLEENKREKEFLKIRKERFERIEEKIEEVRRGIKVDPERVLLGLEMEWKEIEERRILEEMKREEIEKELRIEKKWIELKAEERFEELRFKFGVENFKVIEFLEEPPETETRGGEEMKMEKDEEKGGNGEKD